MRSTTPAKYRRLCSAMVEKSPAAYTVEPCAARLNPVKLSAVTPGSHSVSCPLETLNAARCRLGWPPTAENHPPTYKVDPLIAIAITELLASGLPTSTWPVVASSAAKLAHGCPASL